MRLLTKTTLYFLAALVPLLLFAGFFLYYQFSKQLNERIDEELVTEEIQWIRYIRSEFGPTTAYILRTPEIVIYPTELPVTQLPVFETTAGFDAKENKRIAFRQLTHVVPINGVPYFISIRRSLQQREVMVANITRLVLVVFITLFVVTLLVNWLISRTIWRPFKKSLATIRNAELQQLEAVNFEKASIKEFDELNASLNLMAKKIHNDYLTMKEFTENAAHEMQTPIAVVQSKMELLLQDSELGEQQAEYITQSIDALNRLGKLNQSLLLLARIENKQYDTVEIVDIAETMNKYLLLFDEMIKDKRLEVETNISGRLKVQIHPFLADTLISNLLGNAIKYNYQNGTIVVSITDRSVAISNTSDHPEIERSQVFHRFVKSGTTGNNSNGLGLAIVKKIADTNHLTITYTAANKLHTFTITRQ